MYDVKSNMSFEIKFSVFIEEVNLFHVFARFRRTEFHTRYIKCVGTTPSFSSPSKTYGLRVIKMG